MHYFKRLKLLFSLIFLLFFSQNSLFSQTVIERDGDLVIEFSDGSFRPVMGNNLQDKQLLLSYLKQQNPEETNDIVHVLKVEKVCILASKQRLMLQQEETIQNRQLVESDLKTAKQEKNDENIKVLSKILFETKAKEAKIKDELKEKGKILAKIDKKIIDARKGVEIPKSDYPWVEYNPTASVSSTNNSETTTTTSNEIKENAQEKSIETPKSSKKVPTDDPSAAYKTISTEENVLLNPPKRKYSVVFEGKEELSGKPRKDLEKDILFVHTDDILKNVMKNKDYISCEAYISQIPGYKLLNLLITIQSDNAPKQFGSINKGSSILLKLINGDIVRLFALNQVQGTVIPVDGTTVYHAQYVFSSDDEKLLQKWELDKLRIIWSTGYEEYEVTEMDFFINQLGSLK